ncbi:hypothetical protein, partial [Streptomyces sp. TR02-1]|uniref:hypothetical protein n=1 Tax=Streptomyces sp. TR02-1 TaxID=3385977 RepID=UPI0039A184C5
PRQAPRPASPPDTTTEKGTTVTTTDTTTSTTGDEEQTYWDDISAHAITYAHLANQRVDLHAAARSAVDLHRQHGTGGLVDAAAVMLSMASVGCPDQLRGSDGLPDSDRLTAEAHADLTSSAMRSTRTGARRAADAGRLTGLRPAISRALAAHGPRAAAAALREAAVDKATVLVLLATASFVLRTVAHHAHTATQEENP